VYEKNKKVQVTLAEAREAHASARKLVARGLCPSTEKKNARRAAVACAGNTVKALCEEWYAEMAPHRSPPWRNRLRHYIDDFIDPDMGARPIDQVTPADVLELSKGIARKYPNTGHFLQRTLARIFGYAVRHLRLKSNPARELSGTIMLPGVVHYAALDPKELPSFLKALDAYGGRPSTALAIRALLLTATRKSEVLQARWSEFDLKAATWIIAAERMKTRREHLVPLSTQAVEVFRQLHTLAFGSELVFPNLYDPRRPMNHSTLNEAFERMKIDADPHGLRACFSTWANEQGYRPDVIEVCLAHVERNAVRAAYNRATYLPERRALMQAWADHVSGAAKPQSNVTSIAGHRKRA
jgi:integrase